MIDRSKDNYILYIIIVEALFIIWKQTFEYTIQQQQQQQNLKLRNVICIVQKGFVNKLKFK